MKIHSLFSVLLLGCAGLAQADVSKTTLISQLAGAEVKVRFTSDTTITMGHWKVDFPTTANTKGCAVYAGKVDAANNRRIKAGVEKVMKYGYGSNIVGHNGLMVQGESAIHGIFCTNGGSWDITALTIQDIENSAGGTMTFTVTPSVPIDITE